MIEGIAARQRQPPRRGGRQWWGPRRVRQRPRWASPYTPGHSLRRGSASIIDVRLFKNLRFASGTVSVVLVAIGMFGGMLLLPLYYQMVCGEDASSAGWLFAPQGLDAIVPAPSRHGKGSTEDTRDTEQAPAVPGV